MAKNNKLKEDEIPLLVLTNERTTQKAKMIMMLYKAASLGQLAYMDGLNPDTGEIDALLVGVEPADNDQVRIHPLAKIFNKIDSIPQYMVPDGIGNYKHFPAGEAEAGQAS